MPTTTQDHAITTTTAPATVAAAGRRPLWKHGVTAAAAAAAAAATTLLATAASARGVSFADRTGASIPTAGFAQLTLAFSLLGVAIAAAIARRARRPRTTFVRTAIALTTLSFVPDLTFGFDPASATTLITLHTIAAAIMIPTLATRLTRTR